MVVRGDMIYPPLRGVAVAGAIPAVGHRRSGHDRHAQSGQALGAPPQTAGGTGLLERREASNPKYLQDGDILEVSIATNDGAVDLGTQRTAVRYA